MPLCPKICEDSLNSFCVIVQYETFERTLEYVAIRTILIDLHGNNVSPSVKKVPVFVA